MGCGDWLEVTRDDYMDCQNAFSWIDLSDPTAWEAFSIQGRITDEKLSEYTLDNQAEFQPFVKLKVKK